jgi:sugar porter (SP) family MFS transporter
MDTSTIGPVTSMPHFRSAFGPFSATLEGFIVSSILIPGTIFSFLGGSMADSLGRARAIAIGALAFSLGAALEAAAVTLPMFIAGRCIVGAGQGVFLSVCTVYVCEISPPKLRGSLTSVIQLLITIGLCVGFFTSYGTVKIDSSLSWRLPLALQSGVALFLATMSNFYLPPSPRWLTAKGRRVEAAQAWDRLGVSSAEREKEVLTIENENQAEETANLPFRKRVQEGIRSLTTQFTTPHTRKPLLLGVFMMAMQQLSGIDGVIYYAPLLFRQAGLSSASASFLASGVSAILIFVFTILAVYMVDRWGRRASTIGGGVLMLGCMAIMGISYATNSVHADRGIAKWLVIVTIYVFSVVYSMTWAMGLKLFASEIQPSKSRSSATSIAQGANFITNFFVALITPIILDKTSSGIYFMFGGFLLLTIGVSLVYMPETKGKDLEDISRDVASQKASNAPVVKAFKALVSTLTRRFDSSSASSVQSRSSTREQIELESMSY